MNRVSTKVRVPDLAVMKERGERIADSTGLSREDTLAARHRDPSFCPSTAGESFG